uniref:Uncharacterized protein n=2 Tax=Schistocephalus solidus TaxID=70667 RepID=A0A0X3NSQ1_SCHSO
MKGTFVFMRHWKVDTYKQGTVHRVMVCFAIPGTHLATKDDKNVSGNFTHVHEGNIFANVAGHVVTEEKSDGTTVYSVKPIRQALPIPSIGSIVLAKITSITRRLARCDLVAVGDQPLAGPFRGMIRREDIRSTQRDRAEPSLSFRPGDLIRARVINLIGHVAGGHPSTSLPGIASPDVEAIIGSARAVAAAVTSAIDSSSASSPTCLLSTAEPELGVVLGIGRPPLSGTSSIFGSTGGLPLVPSSWTEMVCPRSMAKFPRKVAKVPNELIDILLSSSSY